MKKKRSEKPRGKMKLREIGFLTIGQVGLWFQVLKWDGESQQDIRWRWVPLIGGPHAEREEKDNTEMWNERVRMSGGEESGKEVKCGGGEGKDNYSWHMTTIKITNHKDQWRICTGEEVDLGVQRREAYSRWLVFAWDPACVPLSAVWEY